MIPAPLLHQLVASERKSVTTAETASRWEVGRGQQNNWSLERATNEGYLASVWVFACVYRIAKSAASVPWRAERRIKGEWEPLDQHPLEELAEHPNPFWSRQDFMERWAMHVHLAGNAFVPKIRGVGGVPVELWLVDPNKVRPVPSQERFLAGYEFLRDGVVFKTARPADVIHHQFTNPANPYLGAAPLMPAAQAVDLDVRAATWQRSSLENRAVSDGALTYPFELSWDQYQEIKRQIRDQHQGPENARTPWIFGNEAQWTNISFNPVEMDYVRGRAFNRTEICASFGVPPPVAGILDDATLANIKTSWEIFWLGTVIPFLDDIRSALNRSLAPEFGRDLRLSFDLSQVEALRPMFREDVNAAAKLWLMGVPFRKVNRRLNLGFTEFAGWDRSFVPLNVVPQELAGQVAQQPPPEAGLQGKGSNGKGSNGHLPLDTFRGLLDDGEQDVS